MNDNEFLNYIDSMTETERCGIAYEHVARLVRLAGDEDFAICFDNREPGFIEYEHEAVVRYVTMARQRMLTNA